METPSKHPEASQNLSGLLPLVLLLLRLSPNGIDVHRLSFFFLHVCLDGSNRALVIGSFVVTNLEASKTLYLKAFGCL